MLPLHLMFPLYPDLWWTIQSLINNVLYISAQHAAHKTKEEILAEYELIKKSQKNPEYFAPIYKKYYDAIFLFIYKRISNTDITGDITSRVFLKCLKSIGRYKYQGVPFSAWLYKIAINEVNLFFRQQSKLERTVSLNDHDIRHLFEEMEYSELEIDPEVLVSVLLEQLTETEVQFIELRFFENRSFKEMGYLLGITEINAKIKTYRILKKLKTLSKQINYND